MVSVASASCLQVASATKTQIAASLRRVLAPAGRRSQTGLGMRKASPTNDAFGSLRVCHAGSTRQRGRIPLHGEPVESPLEHVAGKIQMRKTPGSSRQAAHRHNILQRALNTADHAIVDGPVRRRSLTAPGIQAILPSRCRHFPFRFRRQSTAIPHAKCKRLVPRDAIDRSILHVRRRCGPRMESRMTGQLVG